MNSCIYAGARNPRVWNRMRSLADTWILVSLALQVSVLYSGSAKGDAHMHAADVGGADVVSYWSKKLPSTAIPPAMLTRFSPLSRTQVDSYKQLITAGQLVSDPAAASAFCASADLLCSIESSSAQELLHRNHFRYVELDLSIPRVTVQRLADGDPKEPNTLGSWFLEKHLTTGLIAPRVLASQLLHRDLAQTTRRSFLPRELAQLPGLDLPDASLQLHIPEGSTMGQAMRQTAEFCSAATDASPDSACLVSLEGLADYVADRLQGLQGHAQPAGGAAGSMWGIQALSSSGMQESIAQGTRWFEVGKVEQKADERSTFLSCHFLIFPFLVTLCHHVPDTKIFSVTLQSTALESQEYTISNVVVCHMDTTNWDPHHDAFKLLGTAPGQSEACHWSYEDEFAFLSSPIN